MRLGVVRIIGDPVEVSRPCSGYTKELVKTPASSRKAELAPGQKKL
jgi:hypothetical protein